MFIEINQEVTFMNSQRRLTDIALFPFFLIVGMVVILSLPCMGQEPSASELFARNKILVDRANELFPSPYNNFGPARSYEHTDGVVLPYRLFEPKRENDEIYPMVVFLHGAGGTGTDNLGQFKDLIVPPTIWAFPENQVKHPCYVLVPQGPDWPSWPHARIPALKAMLDSLIANNSIDPNRIYITGLSMGGIGTWAIIQEYPAFFAAAVPICGGGDMNELDGIINNHLPIWAFHGEVDPIVDIDAFSDRWNEEDAWTGQRTLVRELISRGMDPAPKYTWYPDVEHNSWDGAYSDPLLFDWVFSQSKP
jgi:predicted peptidase